MYVGYSRTQKGYRSFDLIHHKFYTFADVTFFESVLYFAPTASAPLTQWVFTRHPKNVVSTSLSVDPKSSAPPNPLHYVSLPNAPPLPMLRWILLLLQTWIF